jgi:hypothetical protein
MAPPGFQPSFHHIVGFWHLDGSHFESGPGQNTMVPSLDTSSHLTGVRLRILKMHLDAGNLY